MIYGLVQKSKKIKIFFSPYLTEEQTVSKWELGETLPDIENLKKMAILFNFSIDEVLGLVAEKADESDVDESDVDENDDDDDSDDWLMIGGFFIGSALGIYLDNTILMFVCTMIGYGLSVIIKALKKK